MVALGRTWGHRRSSLYPCDARRVPTIEKPVTCSNAAVLNFASKPLLRVITLPIPRSSRGNRPPIYTNVPLQRSRTPPARHKSRQIRYRPHRAGQTFLSAHRAMWQRGEYSQPFFHTRTARHACRDHACFPSVILPVRRRGAHMTAHLLPGNTAILPHPAAPRPWSASTPCIYLHTHRINSSREGGGDTASLDCTRLYTVSGSSFKGLPHHVLCAFPRSCPPRSRFVRVCRLTG